MSTTKSWGRQARQLAVGIPALALTLILAACGGGGGGSTQSGDPPAAEALQIANGTVTGFGSTYVDGVEIEDATAAVWRENADGSTSPVALRLGQRVRVQHDGRGTASRVAVHAAVIGAVSAITSSGAGTASFKVAGQSVRVNGSTATGVVTSYGGGYTGFADMLSGDLVEVHGSPVFDSASGSYVIQASRIEKQASIGAVRVMGKVATLNGAAKTFAINGLVVNYAGATLAPANATLVNDQIVAVWGPKNSLTTSGTTVTLTASRVRVMSGAVADSVTSGIAQIGGLVSIFSAAGGTMEIEGLKVSGLATATITPAGSTLASVSNGSYVQVLGTFNNDGVLLANTLRVRQSDTAAGVATVRLVGAISGFNDNASFQVRGVPVDASAINVATSCPTTTLADGVFVNVAAQVQVGTDVVKAVTLSCPLAKVAYAMREVKGTAGSVNVGSMTFVLTSSSEHSTATSSVTVQWSEQTVFTGVSSATLNGSSVKVEGYLNSSGVLVARSIRVPGTADQDRYDRPMSTVPAGSTPTLGMGMGWKDYDNKFRPGRH